MSIGPIQSNGTAPALSVTAARHAVQSPDGLPVDLKADERKIIRAVKSLDSTHLFGENSELTFVYDREMGKTLVRVLDRETKEVVMQIPPEYVLEMAKQNDDRY